MTRTDRIAPQARPFVLPGGDTGVLLVHGFAGSIADLRVFGEFLHGRDNMTVVGVRLAGHGMTVDDLHRSTPDDWFVSARRGYHQLAGMTKRIVVIGESMGALIALHLSRDYPLIKGVVCVAPALRMGNELFRSVVMRCTLPTKRWKKAWVDDARAARGSLRAVTSRSYREFASVVEYERERLDSVTKPVLALFPEGDSIVDPGSVTVLKSMLHEPQLTVRTVPVKSHHVSESDQIEPIAAMLSDFIRRCA